MINAVMRFNDVVRAIGLSRSSIYTRMDPNHKNYDPTFPKPVKTGPRLNIWLESDISAWLENTVLSSRK